MNERPDIPKPERVPEPGDDDYRKRSLPEDTAALGLSFEQTIDDYRKIVFQSFLPRSSSLDSINELLDRMSSAGDRQKAKTHLPTVKGLLDIKKAAFAAETEAHFKALQERDAQDEIWQRQAIEAGRRGPWKPNAAQAQERAKVDARISQSEHNLKLLEKEIDSYTRQVADMVEKLGD